MSFNLRLLGYNIEAMAENNGVNINTIANACNLSANDIHRVFKGRLLLTPAQLCAIADTLHCDVNQLLIKSNNFVSYGKCLGEFKHPENEDKILNIIDDYIDLREAVS